MPNVLTHAKCPHACQMHQLLKSCTQYEVAGVITNLAAGVMGAFFTKSAWGATPHSLLLRFPAHCLLVPADKLCLLLNLSCLHGLTRN